MASRASAINFDDLIPPLPAGYQLEGTPQLPPGYQMERPGMYDDILASPAPQSASAPKGMFDDLIPNTQQDATFNDRFNAVQGATPSAPPQDTTAGALKALGVGVGEGAIGLAGLPGDLTNLGSKLYDYLEGTHTNDTIGPYASAIGSDSIQKGVEHVTGPFYHGETPTQRVLETVGSFVPAVIGGPESIGTKLATRVLAPALASEAAGEATKGTAAEPFARAGAAILGGGAAGALAGAKSLAAPTEEALSSAAKSGYQSPIVQSLRIDPNAMDSFVSGVDNTLLQNKVDKFVAPTVAGILDRLRQPRFDQNGTVADFDLARQSLGDVPYNEKRAATIVRGQIDNYLGNIPASDVVAGNSAAANQILTDARGDYAAMKRSEDVSNALGRAENQAGSTYSGHNLDNATRQQLRPILNQKEGVSKVPAFQDYTDDEIAALKSAVNGSWYGNLVRSAGKTLGGGGGIGHLGAGLTGGIAAHEAGADPMTAIALGLGASIGGRGLNAYANRMAVARTNAVTNLLRSRSPLAARQAAISGQPGVMANITPALAIQALAASRLSPQAGAMISGINGQ